jgi:hypothetical protein
MSKASVATKAAVTTLLGKDAVTAGQLAPSAQLLWDQALRTVRSKRSHKRDLSAIGSDQRACHPGSSSRTFPDDS